MIEDTFSSTFQETRNIKGIKEVVLSVHWSVYVTIYAVIGLIVLVAIMMIVFLRTCGFVHDIHLYHWDSKSHFTHSDLKNKDCRVKVSDFYSVKMEL